MRNAVSVSAARDMRGITLVGHTIASRYELCAPLAYGGMGTVFRGWDHQQCRPVALKVLPIFAAPDLYHARLSQPWWWEAWVMDAVRHPHVVTVYDASRDDERGYVVMEWIAGTNLKRHVARAGPLDYREAMDIGIQVCQALQALHRRGLIHRDVKPHNILRTPTGWVKLADFGIAQRIRTSTRHARPKPASPGPEPDAPSSVLIGTATYCSPEQARGLPLTEATDIYSLGVVLYELLAGVPPFAGETPLSVATQHAIAPVPPLRHVRPDMPFLVERAVMQALAKEPARRFASAQAMRVALEYADTAIAGPRVAFPARPRRTTSRDTLKPPQHSDYSPAMASRAAVHGIEEKPLSETAEQGRYVQLHAFMSGTQWRDTTSRDTVSDAIVEYPTALLARPMRGLDSHMFAQRRIPDRVVGDAETSETVYAVPPAAVRPAKHHTLDVSTLTLCVADAVALLLFVLLVVCVH